MEPVEMRITMIIAHLERSVGFHSGDNGRAVVAVPVTKHESLVEGSDVRSSWILPSERSTFYMIDKILLVE
jgi:hypothetical protein